MTVTVVDEYVAEAVRLEGILGLLAEVQWLTQSGAGGWSVADVVLHLAQSDEGVVASAGGADRPEGAPRPARLMTGWPRWWMRNGPRRRRSSHGGGGHATLRWKRCVLPIRRCRCNG